MPKPYTRKRGNKGKKHHKRTYKKRTNKKQRGGMWSTSKAVVNTFRGSKNGGWGDDK